MWFVCRSRCSRVSISFSVFTYLTCPIEFSFLRNQYCLCSTKADIEIDFYSLGLVEAFKRNLHTLALERKSKKTDLVCYECEKISASEKCIQCEQNYCQQCSIRCHSNRIMRSHEIINISDSAVSLVNGYCSQHKQKPFTSYCKECKIHLCVNCVSEHSNEHDVTNIAKLVSVLILATVLSVRVYVVWCKHQNKSIRAYTRFWQNETEKPDESTQTKVIRELGEKKVLLECLLEVSLKFFFIYN